MTEKRMAVCCYHLRFLTFRTKQLPNEGMLRTNVTDCCKQPSLQIQLVICFSIAACMFISYPSLLCANKPDILRHLNLIQVSHKKKANNLRFKINWKKKAFVMSSFFPTLGKLLFMSVNHIPPNRPLEIQLISILGEPLAQSMPSNSTNKICITLLLVNTWPVVNLIFNTVSGRSQWVPITETLNAFTTRSWIYLAYGTLFLY